MAGVRLLTSMAAHVGGQLATVHEGLATLVALEFPVVLIVLLPFVFGDGHLVCEGLATYIAGHWAISRVCGHVHRIL